MCVGSLLTLFRDSENLFRLLAFLLKLLSLEVFILFAFSQARLIGTDLVFELLALIPVSSGHDPLL